MRTILSDNIEIVKGTMSSGLKRLEKSLRIEKSQKTSLNIMRTT